MAHEIRVPTLGESVTEATVAQWFKKVGDTVKADEPLVELETDKVTLEVPAPAAGVIEKIDAEADATVEVGALLGSIDETGAAASAEVPKSEPAKEDQAAAAATPPSPREQAAAEAGSPDVASPAARKILDEKGAEAAAVNGSGRDGRVTKADALAYAADTTPSAPVQARAPSPEADAGREERVKMSRLRQTIARRLKDAQNTAAMLTTFNEVDMTAVMELRKQYRDLFEKKHGQKLGFMGFFAKACVRALQDVPAVNGEIDGNEIVYKNYYHLGVAVGTERGLVVPVVRDCDSKSMAEIEREIGDMGRRARDGKLGIEEMQGGTFTLSNGGVYGSLMSTPILNAPQSGILGMHKIQERPMAVDGEVKIRPMMYLALSYDHRIVDGREAVTFLVRVKETLEDPQRLVLDL